MAHVYSTNQLLLQKRPLVVGAISHANTLNSLVSEFQNQEYCDIFEIRLDLIDLPLQEIKHLAQQLKRPLLITARHPDEGGKGNLPAAKRAEMLESMLDIASLIDIELRSAMELSSTLQKAQKARIPVVGSFHNFEATPNLDVLEGSIDFGSQFQFSAVKIATFLNTAEDLTRLIQVMSKPRQIPLSVMGMGNLGKVSRLTLAKLGSILNYGYLGEANAPGQWEASALKRLVNEL